MHALGWLLVGDDEEGMLPFHRVSLAAVCR